MVDIHVYHNDPEDGFSHDFTVRMPTVFGDSYKAEKRLKELGQNVNLLTGVTFDSEGSEFFAYTNDFSEAVTLATSLRTFAMLDLGYGSVEIVAHPQ